jgi:hypothetical protein
MPMGNQAAKWLNTKTNTSAMQFALRSKGVGQWLRLALERIFGEPYIVRTASVTVVAFALCPRREIQRLMPATFGVT